MRKRDEIFLLSVNSVYKNFKLHSVLNGISAYTYGDIELKNITETSGEGNDIFFVSKEGGVIFVDYALITSKMIDATMLDDEKQKYTTYEEQLGRIAGVKCFAILAYRECRNDFNKETVFFPFELDGNFIRD